MLSPVIETSDRNPKYKKQQGWKSRLSLKPGLQRQDVKNRDWFEEWACWHNNKG